MRKITIWLASTLAAVALAVCYQLNIEGVGGKKGGEGDHQPPAAASTANPGSGASRSGSTSTSPAPEATNPQVAQPGDSSEAKTGGNEQEHTDKPGENK